MDNITPGMGHFQENVLEFDQMMSKQYSSIRHSSAECRLKSKNSEIFENDKSSTVQKRIGNAATWRQKVVKWNVNKLGWPLIPHGDVLKHHAVQREN